MSDSVQPHRWQPTRFPVSWDSPGKNTGVGCHFPLQCYTTWKMNWWKCYCYKITLDVFVLYNLCNDSEKNFCFTNKQHSLLYKVPSIIIIVIITESAFYFSLLCRLSASKLFKDKRSEVQLKILRTYLSHPLRQLLY